LSLLGLDIGTTGCKAVAFDLEGRIIAQAYYEYPLLHPQPGWVELNTELLWIKIKQVLKNVASQTRKDPPEALGISCQGEAVVPVDKKSKALYNFIVTFDKRTELQSQWWDERLGREKIFQITGMPLHPMYTINKIMWFKEKKPEIYKKTWKFLCMEDFVIFKLGLLPTIDYSLAARTMAFDIRKETWSEKILSLAGIDINLLAEVKPSGYAVGKVPLSVAQELGLQQRLVVSAGGHDQPCGALGAGVTKPGLAMNAIGTSDVLCPAFASPIFDKKMLENGYCCYHHTYPNTYTTISFNLTGGLLLKWYRDNFCFEERIQAEKIGKDVYDVIVERIHNEPVDVYILPHFVGSGTPTLDSRSKGAILGLTLDTTKRHLSRAVLDSNNYDLRMNAERLEHLGISIGEIRVIGGGAKSKIWMQLRADVLAKKVRTLKVSEAASLGAAILAGASIGRFSIQEGASRLVHIDKTFQPNIHEHEKYTERYQRYLEIYPALKQWNSIA